MRGNADTLVTDAATAYYANEKSGLVHAIQQATPVGAGTVGDDSFFPDADKVTSLVELFTLADRTLKNIDPEASTAVKTALGAGVHDNRKTVREFLSELPSDVVDEALVEKAGDATRQVEFTFVISDLIVLAEASSNGADTTATKRASTTVLTRLGSARRPTEDFPTPLAEAVSLIKQYMEVATE